MQRRPQHSRTQHGDSRGGDPRGGRSGWRRAQPGWHGADGDDWGGNSWNPAGQGSRGRPEGPAGHLDGAGTETSFGAASTGSLAGSGLRPDSGRARSVMWASSSAGPSARSATACPAGVRAGASGLTHSPSPRSSDGGSDPFATQAGVRPRSRRSRCKVWRSRACSGPVPVPVPVPGAGAVRSSPGYGPAGRGPGGRGPGGPGAGWTGTLGTGPGGPGRPGRPGGPGSGWSGAARGAAGQAQGRLVAALDMEEGTGRLGRGLRHLHPRPRRRRLLPVQQRPGPDGARFQASTTRTRPSTTATARRSSARSASSNRTNPDLQPDPDELAERGAGGGGPRLLDRGRHLAHRHPADPRTATSRAAARNLSGGSTITQEFVRQYYSYDSIGTQQTASRKIKEIFVAMKLAKSESKPWILQHYMNCRSTWARTPTESRRPRRPTSGKPVGKLTVAQDAVIAALHPAGKRTTRSRSTGPSSSRAGTTCCRAW